MAGDGSGTGDSVAIGTTGSLVDGASVAMGDGSSATGGSVGGGSVGTGSVVGAEETAGSTMAVDGSGTGDSVVAGIAESLGDGAIEAVGDGSATTDGSEVGGSEGGGSEGSGSEGDGSAVTEGSVGGCSPRSVRDTSTAAGLEVCACVGVTVWAVSPNAKIDATAISRRPRNATVAASYFSPRLR
jgi:hypothetical protein